MALSPEELSRIRDVVRGELNQRHSGLRISFRIILLLAAIFLGVLFLHVLVIAGFTIWHLNHSA
jgi:hypothetical protein